MKSSSFIIPFPREKTKTKTKISSLTKRRARINEVSACSSLSSRCKDCWVNTRGQSSFVGWNTIYVVRLKENIPNSGKEHFLSGDEKTALRAVILAQEKLNYAEELIKQYEHVKDGNWTCCKKTKSSLSMAKIQNHVPPLATLKLSVILWLYFFIINIFFSIKLTHFQENLIFPLCE